MSTPTTADEVIGLFPARWPRQDLDKKDWEAVRREPEFKAMSLRLRAVRNSQYVRLRGTSMPPNVPFETDASGNPLPDLHTNATATNVATQQIGSLKIPCTAAGTNVPPLGAAVPAGATPSPPRTASRCEQHARTADAAPAAGRGHDRAVDRAGGRRGAASPADAVVAFPFGLVHGLGIGSVAAWWSIARVVAMAG
jgi:hypothetical protein